MATEQFFFLLRTQLAIIRKTDILAACDQIEKVLFQIRSGAGDGMDFVPANHFRQRNAQLSGAHGAGERDHHFPAVVQMRDVGIGSVFQDRSVEVPVVAINELADAAHFYSPIFAMAATAFDAKLLPRQSSVNRVFAENFSRHGGKDRACQDLRCYTE